MEGASRLEATFGQVAVRMAQSLELEEVLGAITRGLVRDLGAAMARIWLVRPNEPGVLQLAASAGLSESKDGAHARVPVGSLKIGQIAETRAPVCTSELLGDPRFVDKAWIRENALAAFAGYPLEYGGGTTARELLGVLAIFARSPISAEEQEQLQLFAAQASIAIKNASLFSAVQELTQKLEAENAYLKEELHESAALGLGLVGESSSFVRLMDELGRVAPTASTVLVQGETGTGKELVARAIHEKSPRRTGPLVKVNCAALAPTLVESELFGHERGAFTGATQRRLGRFELAQGGTLFLDEISELPLDAQAKLLRVLQEREVERVGGTHPIRVDARIVAATNRDLAAEAKAGRFRPDLYYRLAVFPLVVPPLRDRRADVPLLAAAFLANVARSLGVPPKQLDDDAAAYLSAYDWPGNVRELSNVLERAMILSRREGDRIGVGDLPELTPTETAPAAAASESGSLKDRVTAYERALLVETLRLAKDNQSEAARLLRTSRATLQYKLKLHGLS
jgi:transcriptional regulator with GAF, ATPase, and Fis domain